MAEEPPDCGSVAVHPESVGKVRSSLPDDRLLYGLADFFRLLADPTRVKILHALFVAELCVCDIASLLDVSRSAVSHQLAILRQSNLVAYRRKGKSVYYRLSDDHVKQIVSQGLRHLNEPGAEPGA